MNFFLSNKKKLLLLIIALYSTHSYLVAQEREVPKSAFLEDVRFGGSLGLNVNNDYFSGYIAPKAIYDFNSYASAGVGLLGSYNNTSRYSSYTTGGSLIGLFRPLNPLQLSAEFEEHYVSRNFELDGANKSDSYWYPAFPGFGLCYRPREHRRSI